MLVLSRKTGEKIVINGNIEVTVVFADNGKARLGIVAPQNISVDREEVYKAKKAQRAKESINANNQSSTAKSSNDSGESQEPDPDQQAS